MERCFNSGLQAELASFLMSPPGLLCPSDEDFSAYGGKSESIMESSFVPTFGFSLSVLILSWKPSDQGDVGRSPERIFPEIRNMKPMQITKAFIFEALLC